MAQKRQHSTEDVIARLGDRLMFSTLLEDRRAAVLGLKGMSKKFPEEVAVDSFDALLQTIARDASDDETIRAALEILVNLTLIDEASGMRSKELVELLASRVSEKESCVIAVVDNLQSTDFYRRLYALQFLGNLFFFQSKVVPNAFLKSHIGVSCLVRCLSESHEALSTEALILLIKITEGSPEIQKLVAFENCFDAIFDIIDSEGSIEGGHRVNDSLQLLQNLLRFNMSNQTLFRESNHMVRLANILALDENPGQIEWAPIKQDNAIMMLHVCHVFVDMPGPFTSANQEAILRSGVLDRIAMIAFAIGVPAVVCEKALWVCSDLIHGCRPIQEYFDSLKMRRPEDPQKHSKDPGLSTEKVNGDEDSESSTKDITITDFFIFQILNHSNMFKYGQRLAAIACIDGLLYKRYRLKLEVMQSLSQRFSCNLKEFSDINLLSEILVLNEEREAQPDRVWFASVVLMHLIFEDSNAKAFLRAIKVEGPHNNEDLNTIKAMTLNLQSCLSMGQDIDTRITLGYLMVLCVWLHEDSLAVAQFLSVKTILTTLCSCISLTSSPFNYVIQGIVACLLCTVVEYHSDDKNTSQKDLIGNIKGQIEPDLVIQRMRRLRQDPSFRNYSLEMELANLEDIDSIEQFDILFVDFLKDNYIRLERALTRNREKRPIETSVAS